MPNLRLLCWAAAERLTHLRMLMGRQTGRKEAERQTIMKVSSQSTASFWPHNSAQLVIRVSSLPAEVQLRDNMAVNLQRWLL